MSASKRYALFIGRWQPPHNGHKWLFEQALSQGKSILIAIRDVEPNEGQPLTATQVKGLLEKMYAGDDRVRVMVIPDIESVNYGRGVGYEVIELKPNLEIAAISATEIRKRLRAGDPSWKDLMDPSIHEEVESLLK